MLLALDKQKNFFLKLGLSFSTTKQNKTKHKGVRLH